MWTTSATRLVAILLSVNFALQLFDGLATYYGLSLGVQEGNPLLRYCMDCWGVGVTLAGAKIAACLLLLCLRLTAYMAMSVGGLVLIATSYTMFSFVPWLVLLIAA